MMPLNWIVMWFVVLAGWTGGNPHDTVGTPGQAMSTYTATTTAAAQK